MLFSWEGSRAKNVSSFIPEFPLKILRKVLLQILKGFPGGAMIKNLSANAKRDRGSVLGSRRSPGVGNGNPLQYCFVLFCFWKIPWT